MRVALCNFVLALALAACATAEEQSPQVAGFSLEVQPSRLPFQFGPITVGPSNVPFDRSYDQLTREQKLIINGWYEQMGDGDEPPFPLQGLEAIYRPIAEAQAFLSASGSLLLEVVIDSAGTPQEVRVLMSPSKRISTTVGQIAMLTKFKPALCAGRACRMSFPLSIKFRQR